MKLPHTYGGNNMNAQARRTQALMLAAASDLLAEQGAEAVTHLKVAQRAGVARATVYRHWPDRAAILVDLLRASADLAPLPSESDLGILDRVTATLHAFARALNGDGGRTLAAMIGLAEWDKDVFAALERITEFGPTLLRSIVSEGVSSGLLIDTANPDLIADMLIGPLYFRRLLYHDQISNAYVEGLVRRVIPPLLRE